MVVVAVHLGELGFSHGVEGPLPEVGGIGQDVGLVDQGEAQAVLAADAVVEGPAEAAVDAEAGGDHLLRGHLLGGVLAQVAAGAAVEVLGVFADHVETDVFGALVLEGAVHAGIEADGAEVDVLVELEADGEEEALLQHAGGDVRVADGAEVDGVELAEFVDLGFRDDLAGGEVAVAAVVEVGPLVADVLQGGDGFEDFERFGGDFGAGSVAGDYG